MFQKINFTRKGGFPLTQNTMDFVQGSYNNVLEALARAVGNYVIISGVTEIAPGVYSEGWVTYDNKILPFSGGSELNFVDIIQSNSDVVFKNGQTIEVTTGYTAVFSSVNNGILFTDFKRLSLKSLSDRIEETNDLANEAYSLADSLAVGAVPSGVVVLWSGAIVDIPVGWALCNGSNGTPDLRDRFVPGAGNLYTVNQTGGTNTVTLSINQIPAHNHTMNTAGNHQHFVREGTSGNASGGGTDNTVKSWNESGTIKNTSFSGDHIHIINNNGGGQPHENRPLFYSLAYIMKL